MQSLSSPTQPRLKRRTPSITQLSTDSPSSPLSLESPGTSTDLAAGPSLALGDISAELGARKTTIHSENTGLLKGSVESSKDFASGANTASHPDISTYRYPSPAPNAVPLLDRTSSPASASDQLSPIGTHAHAIPPRRPSTDYHSEEDTASMSHVSFTTSNSGRYVTDQANSFVDLLETSTRDANGSSALPADQVAAPLPSSDDTVLQAGSLHPPSITNASAIIPGSGATTPRMGVLTSTSSQVWSEGVESLRDGLAATTPATSLDSHKIGKSNDALLSPPQLSSRADSASRGSSAGSAASSSTAVSLQELAPAAAHKLKFSPASPEPQEWGANFWCVITDPGSGQAFFANPTTGACAWEVPAGTLVLPPNPEGQWWELYDEARNLPYFYHTQTHSSTWVRPAGFVIPLKAIQETTLGRRFSRKAFGQDSLADLAYADRRRSIKAGQTLKADARARSNPSAARRSNAPAPPTLSPSINQVLALQAQKKAATAKPKPLRTMGSRDDLIAQAMAAPVKARPGHPPLRSRLSQSGFGLDSPTTAEDPSKEASGSRDSALRSQYPPRAATTGRARSHSQPINSDEHERKGAWRPGSSNSVGAAVKAAVTRSRSKTFDDDLSSPRRSSRDTLQDRSLDLSTLSSFEITKPARRDMDEVKQTASEGHASKLRGASSRGLNKLFSSGGNGAPVPTQRLSSGEHHVLPSGLANEIRQFAFDGYAARHFLPHRKGLLRRKESSKTRSRWQREPITAPLLPIERDLHKDALNAFKVVLRICGDRDGPAHAVLPRPVLVGYGTVPDRVPFQRQNSQASSLSLLDGQLDSTRPTNGVYGGGARNDSGFSTANANGEIEAPTVLDEERWLLERGILGSPMMRDELYSQVLKQLRDNPSEMSTFRGWQLLCVFLVSFPPSRDFFKYVRAFLEEQSTRPVVGPTPTQQAVDPIPVMAKHSLGRLDYINRRGAKGKAPSIEEIKCAQDAAFNPSVFGHTLEDVMATQKGAYPDVKVPILCIFLTEAMLAMGATDVEGVFRVSGDPELTSQLMVRIERGQYSLDGLVGEVDEEGNLVQSDVDADVAVLTSVLKLWLRELQEPLIPSHMYEDCLSAARFPHQSVKMIEQLPELNRRVVVYLVSFLQNFCGPEVVARTRMSVDSLARIWAPNFLRCEADVVERAAANSRLEHEFVAQLLLAGAPPRSASALDGRTTPTMSRQSSSTGLRMQAAPPAGPSATPATAPLPTVPVSPTTSTASSVVGVRMMHAPGRALTPITEPPGGSSIATSSADGDSRLSVSERSRSSMSFASRGAALNANSRAGTPLRPQMEGGAEDSDGEDGRRTPVTAGSGQQHVLAGMIDDIPIHML